MNNQLFLPLVAENKGTTVKELAKSVNPNGRFINNMWHESVADQYWYYEVCDTPYGRGQYHPASTIQQYWLNNQRKDQHYSVFAHDEKWLKNLKSTGSVSCQNTRITTDLLWIEIDRKDPQGNSNFYKAIEDALTIRRRLQNEVRKQGETTDGICWVFTSGNNSSHVAINTSIFGRPITDQSYKYVWNNLAHLIAGDVRFNNGTMDVRKDEFEKILTLFKLEYGDITVDRHTILQAMENIDPNIYRVNSLIRQPWSIHPTGGFKKALVRDDGNFDYKARILTIPQKQPVLLSWWLDSFEKKEKKKRVGKVYDSSYIINTFSKYVEGFDPDNADANGWVKAYNPFYADGNPDCAYNIENGYVYDFGDPTYDINFDEFLIKIREL